MRPLHHRPWSVDRPRAASAAERKARSSSVHILVIHILDLLSKLVALRLSEVILHARRGTGVGAYGRTHVHPRVGPYRHCLVVCRGAARASI